MLVATVGVGAQRPMDQVGVVVMVMVAATVVGAAIGLVLVTMATPRRPTMLLL